MKFRTIVATITAFIFLSGVTNGGIKEIGPFTGMFSEGFENHQIGFHVEIDVLDGDSIARTMYGNANILVVIGWDFYGFVRPHNGSKFMGSCGEPVEWVFGTPAIKFGGYFTTNSDINDAVAKFYDENSNLLAELNITVPMDNSWVWNGWETDGAPIERVQIIGNFGWGGFVMHDDIEFTPIPEPATILLVGLGGLALRRRSGQALLRSSQ